MRKVETEARKAVKTAPSKEAAAEVVEEFCRQNRAEARDAMAAESAAKFAYVADPTSLNLKAHVLAEKEARRMYRRRYEAPRMRQYLAEVWG